MLNIEHIRKKVFNINKSEFPGGKQLACIAKLGKQIFIGHNNRKTHPSMLKYFDNGEEGSCSHAEVSALAKVPRQSRHKAEIYVIRFLRNGDISMAKPCCLCQKFFTDNDVKTENIYYTDWSWDGVWKKLSRLEA